MGCPQGAAPGNVTVLLNHVTQFFPVTYRNTFENVLLSFSNSDNILLWTFSLFIDRLFPSDILWAAAKRVARPEDLLFDFLFEESHAFLE